ncbi:hypothetical protein [Archangium sp.]|uniref:hypothetical protein n=1 Tax=Archangium sp. TaxID=1872627 RepID=UPI002ED9025E
MARIWLVLVLMGLPLGAAGAEERFLLIWESAPTARAAQAALAKLQAPPWKGFVFPKEGYPRIEESSKVPGLRPGSWVVMMGACSTVAEGSARTDLLRIMGKLLGAPVKPSVRKLQDARPLACPELLTMRRGSHLTEETANPRHELEIFEVPGEGWSPPAGVEAGDLIVLLEVDGRPVDGRFLPMRSDFFECLFSDFCPLILIREPKRPERFVALLRDGFAEAVKDFSCDTYNEEEPRPTQGTTPLEPPNRYEVFALARLEVTWNDQRLLKVQRKELGVKCCLALEETCREPLKKGEE